MKITGWSLFHIICRFRQDDICQSRFEGFMEDGVAPLIPDSEYQCTEENCGIWSDLEEPCEACQRNRADAPPIEEVKR